ncbi:MAG: Smr/MutS family protein [Oscillospiraceae bacterium]|nr:Smr/MutS family protein [Oscillospiraceae bacterium]
MAIHTANLEQGMPTVEQAIIRMDQAIRSAKSKRGKVLKLIHGYGSSGKGGAIRDGVQSALAAHQRAGRIRAFVPGEAFSPFYPESRAAVDICPELLRDRDYTRPNHGITIVVL